MFRPRSEERINPASPGRRDVLAGLGSASVAATLPPAASTLRRDGMWQQSWGLLNESHLFFVEWEL